ncbi:hypothetical protein THAR02_02515 [Trichoderma harzianum]|uniref:Uncharacterized protein n=1 Tax=Trichoderma harzianum TaxID=5544 RepID=A0A0F9XLP7_TRIHA|nr:hypothetical protein THAR02_02515 [Trichoderma harzianum]
MGIYPGGKSVRIDSPRHLTIRHARNLVAVHQRNVRLALRSSGELQDEGESSEEEIDPLPAGQQKLNSYWAPGLEAGKEHIVSVEQDINPNTTKKGSKKLHLTAEQGFFVDAPQFSLPDGSVHSTYPPAGYSDDHRILPHIVLTDPHLPWERLGSPKQGTNAELREKVRLMALGSLEEKPVRNRVPWLVVLAFDQSELRLPPEDLDKIFSATSDGVIKPVKQSSTMTVNMSIADLWKLPTSDVITPVTPDLGPESMKDSRGDFIFVQPEIFKSFFSTWDEDNNRVIPENNKADTLQYQYLAHVRKINGSGMALAGVENTAVFSIVIGNRSGPLDNQTPTTMCAHLVSIEGVEDMAFPSDSQRYVALCSLYSWNYTVLPPDTLNVPDAFEHLGRTLDVLRAPESIIKPLRDAPDKVRQRIASRLDDGYTLVKYRTQTGEPTVALYRGPFTPTYVPDLAHLTKSSNSSVDLQILDKELGIMDITYSIAWQTGRTMALGDEVFTAALNRLRTAIHGPAMKTVKLQTIKDINDISFRTKDEVLEDLPEVIQSLANIHIRRNDGNNFAPPVPGQPFFSPGGAKKRWFRPKMGRSDLPNMSFTDLDFEQRYKAAAVDVARRLAGSKSQGLLYDETNDPVSTDWMIVLSWLVDKMFLSGVPAHSLIPDPTYLGPESLRFFRIDKNWIDSMIDGALSLGNHSLVDDDRVAIKTALNLYIDSIPKGAKHKIQIPAYGFYLRSDLVTMFPDLRVEVLPDEDALRAAGEEPPAGAPLLRHDIVTDGIMMGFMDRLPGSNQFGQLVFTQPAHQQRFAVARGLDVDKIKVNIRKQYTVDQKTRETDDGRHDKLTQIITNPTGDKSKDNIFIWGSKPGQGLNDLRILRLPKYADVQLEELEKWKQTAPDGTPYFKDDTATSALFSMQLNDPVYKLTVDLKAHPENESLAALGPSSGPSATEVRTLRQLEPARMAMHPGYRQGGSGVSSQLARHDDDDDAEGAAGVTFQRHGEYVPTVKALAKNLAPHIRHIPTISAHKLPKPSEAISSFAEHKPRDRFSDPASAPRYRITVSSNIGSHWDVITLRKPNLQQDIIFAVSVEQNQSNQYMLAELDIQIKLGPAKTDDNYLMPTYAGTGAIMLTNLRFNVLPQILDDGGQRVLRLRVLPRAAKGWIDIGTVKELGFMLGLAQVNESLGDPTQVELDVWAIYCKDAENPKLGDDNTVKIPNSITTRVTVFDNPQWAQ